jgi:predicted glutamine amidotransferase
MLAVVSSSPFDCSEALAAFARTCKESREYQGHGFGVAWRQGDNWTSHHDLTPIWEAELPAVGETTHLIAHARSAFRDEGIVIEHNMPFLGEDGLVFAFNGELRGVRVKVPGANGAWRLLNLLKRLRDSSGGDLAGAITRLNSLIHKRSDYVRALNLVVSDGDRIWINNQFSEDPDYFTMQKAQTAGVHEPAATIVSSDPFQLTEHTLDWQPIGCQPVFELKQPAECS